MENKRHNGKRRTLHRDDHNVSFNAECSREVYERVLKFFLDRQMYSDEGFYQSDIAMEEAQELIFDLVGPDFFDFEPDYDPEQ